MASTEVANSYTYDVFLSFRGEDTRYNFIDHLYNALSNKGIHTFIDAKLPRGEEISAELIKAIEESRVSIIVFSENYASSRWCLDELVHILRCKESNQQMVIPVFYKVDPSDVRNQRGRFGEAFAKLDQYKYCMNKWRAALSTAANLSGWPFSDGKYESQFISNIVEELSSQVLVRHFYNLEVAKYPVGIEPCVQDIHKLLDIGKNTVPMEVIWGIGGIGKTLMLKVGPFGSRKGEIFDDGSHSTVRQLVIHHSAGGINAIQIEYDQNGSSFWSDLHGEPDLGSDSETDTVKLDYPEEFLTSVHANFFKLWPLQGQICSIAFNSNKRCYGPYGNELGDYFSIEAPASKIVGFHGRISPMFGMRAIGAYLKPYDVDEKYHPSKAADHCSKKKALDHSSSSMVPGVPVPQNNYQYKCTFIINNYN